MKVMIGCGTRPGIIRLAAVIKRCREYFDCCVVYYKFSEVMLIRNGGDLQEYLDTYDISEADVATEY